MFMSCFVLLLSHCATVHIAHLYSSCNVTFKKIQGTLIYIHNPHTFFSFCRDSHHYFYWLQKSPFPYTEILFIYITNKIANYVWLSPVQQTVASIILFSLFISST